MKLEHEIKLFKDLIPEAAELHNYTFCVKLQAARITKELDAHECVTCPEFVLRGGICDPL